MLKDAQKKAKWAGIPIADVQFVMMALAAILVVQHFPRKVNDWESLPSTACMWTAWKQSFCIAHLKRQHQILASGGGGCWGAHGVLPAVVMAIGQLECALDNLALVATIDSDVLQQLTAVNLALTTTLMALTATNKTFVDSAAKAQAAANLTAMAEGRHSIGKPWPGNYCWTHDHQASKEHMSATCGNKAVGHRDDATTANTMGGSNKDKGWQQKYT
jgi:hypothetical protein